MSHRFPCSDKSHCSSLTFLLLKVTLTHTTHFIALLAFPILSKRHRINRRSFYIYIYLIPHSHPQPEPEPQFPWRTPQLPSPSSSFSLSPEIPPPESSDHRNTASSSRHCRRREHILRRRWDPSSTARTRRRRCRHPPTWRCRGPWTLATPLRHRGGESPATPTAATGSGRRWRRRAWRAESLVRFC